MRGPHPTPELHQRLAKASEKESIPVAISYRAAELDVLGPGAPSEIIAATIAETSEPIVAWLARRGFVETGRARYAPVVFGNLSAGAIEQIAHDERLAAVSADDAREALELAAQDPVKKHNIDSVWNSAGNYAEKQPVGLIEACQAETFGPYTLFDDHEAFAFNASKPIYEVSPPMNQCNSSADCAGSGCSGPCIDKKCVNDHGSQVASVITASNGARHGAAEIQMYVANGAKPTTLAGHIASYDFMVENDVFTVNESFYGGGSSTADYYARKHNILVVKGAGNFAQARDAACANTANGICAGASEIDDSMACYSSYLNPPSFPDREEPDLVAFGGGTSAGCSNPVVDGVRVMGFANTSDWSGEGAGTSLSAPSVTSIVAHLRTECEPYFGFMGERLIRAIMRTGAWNKNPTDGRYSTPSLNHDYKDGAGFIEASGPDWFCQPGGPSAGEVVIDLDGGSEMPHGKTTYTPGEPHPGTKNYAPPSSSPPDRKAHFLADAYLKVGNRVRFTIAWNACTTSANDGNASAAVDLDLFLYNKTKGTYVYGSQSIHDNNEGFDVTLSSSDGDGDYQVIVAWEKGSQDCDGATELGFGWAGRWGSPW